MPNREFRLQVAPTDAFHQYTATASMKINIDLFILLSRYELFCKKQLKITTVRGKNTCVEVGIYVVEKFRRKITEAVISVPGRQQASK